jgi:hypothetical protein
MQSELHPSARSASLLENAAMLIKNGIDRCAKAVSAGLVKGLGLAGEV